MLGHDNREPQNFSVTCSATASGVLFSYRLGVTASARDLGSATVPSMTAAPRASTAATNTNPPKNHRFMALMFGWQRNKSRHRRQ